MIFRGGRQRFLDRFEPSGTAFVYRRMISSPGVLVSAKEHAALVEQYEDRRLLFQLYLLADLPVTIGVTALAYAIDPSHKAYPAVAWLTLFFSPAIVAIWSENGPNKLIKKRAPIDNGLPSEQVKARMIERASWGFLTWNFLFAAMCGFESATDHSMHFLLRSLFFIISVIALSLAAKELVSKIRYEKRYSHPLAK